MSLINLLSKKKSFLFLIASFLIFIILVADYNPASTQTGCSVTRGRDEYPWGYESSIRYDVSASCFTNNGWVAPVPSNSSGDLSTTTWYDFESPRYAYHWGFEHGGVDFDPPPGLSYTESTPVYAIGDGIVVRVERDDLGRKDNSGNPINMSVIFIKHESSTGKEFLAVYGHTYPDENIQLNSEVKKGLPIGTLRQMGSPIHLHFEITTNLNPRFYGDGLYAPVGWGSIKNETQNPLQFLIDNPGTVSPGFMYGVTPANYDDMGKILTNMGRTWEEISGENLTNYEAIKGYKAIFLNCGYYIEGASDSLNQYVSQGGALYASDYAIDFIIEAFPNYIELPIDNGRIGYDGTVEARIIDSGLATYINPNNPPSTIELNFDLGGWVVIDSVAPDVQIYLRGDIETFQGFFEDRPLLISFEYGLGRVVFTSFHNEPQLTDLQVKLLEYLVLIPETSQVVNQLKGFLEDIYPGIVIDSEFINLISQNKTSTPSIYKASGGTDLIFGLNWGGSTLKLSVYDPSGQLHSETSSDNPPIALKVNNAEAGDWSFTVTGVDIPYDNYSYVVMAGQVETDTEPTPPLPYPDPTPTPDPEPETDPVSEIKLGDITGNGKINVEDVTLVMQYVLGLKTLTDDQKMAADVNGDGIINVIDVTLILQKALGLINKFPAE